MAAFDPYHQWLGIPAHEQPAHHYRLLGISPFEDNADVIDIAADRQMKFLAQIVDGPNVKDSQRLLNELSAARICLLNPDKKTKYDSWLKQELAKGTSASESEKPASRSASEINKKPPAGNLRKQTEKLLAEHEYDRAQELLREMIASTEEDDAAWARQQMAKAKSGDENMRRQAESAIQYSRKLINTHEYSDAIQLLEQFPSKFRSEKLRSNLQEATKLQQEVDLLQVDISRFMNQRNYVELKVAVKRFLELKPANARMKQLWTDLNTYGNKPVVFLEPEERKAYELSAAGGISTLQMIVGAAIVSLLFGATLYATYYYVGNSKQGTEKTVATAEASNWKVDLQIDNPDADVRIDGQPVKLTGKQTKLYLPPGNHGWIAKLAAGESKSGQFEVRKMETNSLVIAVGQPVSPESTTKTWNTVEFQAWSKEVAAMDAEQQLVSVVKRLQDLNPSFDGNVTNETQNGVVTVLRFIVDNVNDISPVRALTGLHTLALMGSESSGSQLSDLTALTGMKLKYLHCDRTKVSDLSPLRGMPLIFLALGQTPVADLSPVSGMDFEVLYLYQTQVTDLSSLDRSKINTITLTPKRITKGMEVLRQMSSLNQIGIGWEPNSIWPAAEFWKKYDAGEFGERKPDSMPLEQWAKEIGALPAEKQVDAATNKLKELNPEFDGNVTHQIENGAVTMLGFNTDKVKDISPVRALTGLQTLNMLGSEVDYAPHGQLSDLSQLNGMNLKSLNCSLNPINSLSPLQGMKLETLDCNCTNIADLTPLKEMPLATLICYRTKIIDLTALSGLPLKSLSIGGSPVSDLSPLRGMQLTHLRFRVTRITDLTPLVGMPLTVLEFDKNDVTDLTPLKEMNLTELMLTPSKIKKGLDDIRRMQSLTRIGIGWTANEQWPAAEFWQKYDAGDFNEPSAPDRKPVTNVNDPAFQKWVKDTGKLSAEKQLAAVVKKLQELNPGFDGKVTPKIESGGVTELEFSTTNVSDIAPVRALSKLVVLRAIGNNVNYVPDGKLFDLTPLLGMRLKTLACGMNEVNDLSPLRWIPLTTLKIEFTQVADLSPISGMKLHSLDCGSTKITDLSPLKGMPLKELIVQLTNVSDLSPIAKLKLSTLNCGRTLITDIAAVKGMPLEHVFVQETKVADLTPLAGMPLVSFNCSESDVTDLTPLKDAKLKWVVITPSSITNGIEIIRQMPTVVQIATSWRPTDHFLAAEFWKKYDAGDFKK